MKNKKILIITIAVLTTIFLIIIFCLAIFKHNSDNGLKGENISSIENNDNTQNTLDVNNVNILNEDNISEEEGAKKIEYEKIESVTNQTYFYTVENCIKKYLEYTTDLRSDDSKKNKEKVYNLLSQKYVSENNINYSNLKQYVEYEDNIEFAGCTRMVNYNIEKNNIIRFGAEALFFKDNNPYYMNYIIYLDYSNLTYSIEPIKNDIAKLSKEDFSEKEENISNNTDNEFEYEVISEEELVDKYFEFFGYIVDKNPNFAYEYLEDQYRKQNFENISDWLKYVNSNKDVIENIKIKSIKIYESNGKVEYVCEDTYSNMYTVTENGIMQIKISFNNI